MRVGIARCSTAKPAQRQPEGDGQDLSGAQARQGAAPFAGPEAVPRALRRAVIGVRPALAVLHELDAGTPGVVAHDVLVVPRSGIPDVLREGRGADAASTASVLNWGAGSTGLGPFGRDAAASSSA